MPEIDDKKQEPKKPELKPDDGAAHTLSAFAQSLAYSAVEAPSRGVAQLIDHAATTHLDAAIQHKFDNAGFHQPDAAAYGTHAWAAQHYDPAKMPELTDRWMRLEGTNERDRFFRGIRADGQQMLCDALLNERSESNLAFLSLMAARTESSSHDIVDDTYKKMLAILNAKTPPESSATDS